MRSCLEADYIEKRRSALGGVAGRPALKSKNKKPPTTVAGGFILLVHPSLFSEFDFTDRFKLDAVVTVHGTDVLLDLSGLIVHAVDAE